MKPLSDSEYRTTTGGWFWNLVAGISAYELIKDALNNLPDIREGFHDGYNGLEPRHKA